MTKADRGRRGARWRKLKADVRARCEPCIRCGQAIDYTLTYPEPGSFTVDHYPYNWADYPQHREDPANLHAAHMRCNQAAGNTEEEKNLGPTSRNW